MNQVCAEEDFAEAEGVIIGTELLKGQYLVQSRLRSGGFGITYIARDSLARRVVIKECYPAELCKRNGVAVEPASPDLSLQFSAIKNQFIREARQMAQLVHPNIVSVHQVFEENNTAYMALDFIDGTDLVSLVEDQPQRITNSLLRSVLRQSLKAINFIHRNGLLHRDIAPDNMMMDAKGHLTLIDFGAARDCEGKNRSTVIAVKDGYSPIEFYDPDGTHGFYSDLYSLAATLYYLAVGAPPPSSEERLETIEAGGEDPYVPLTVCRAERITRKDEQIFKTIDRALSVHVEDRYESVAAWAKDLVNQQVGNSTQHTTVARTPPALENEIAQIVETTNAQLVVKHDRSKTTSTEETKQEPPERKITVDLFGTPIEDVVGWHAQQEAEIRARTGEERTSGENDPGTSKTDAISSDAGDPERERIKDVVGSDNPPDLEEDSPSRRNSLTAFLGRCLGPKRNRDSK